MTFSIVAVDSQSGAVGFAIASCCWDAGAVCAAKPGVGAIASQAQGNLAFHRMFLESDAGLDEMMRRFRESDPDIETRQVGMVSASGERLAFTGAKVASMFRHRTGEGYSCQGNTLVSGDVVDRMAEAFEQAQGTLLERLYTALKAGDDAGGDARGRQSARLFVAGGAGPFGNVDIRIEDGESPVREIGRILDAGKELLATLSLFSEFDASKPDRDEVLAKAKAFMEGRWQSKHIDFWMEFGAMCDAMGDADGSVDALRVVLEIRPDMKENLVADARRGLLPKAWAEILLEGQE